MSVWILAALVYSVLLTLAVAILWIRQVRPPKEDARLSRGLQLLQSKIAVLEDLSDRTEVQVKQLTQILDERAKNLQTKMLKAEETMAKIDQSIQKSLNVADIFQDKIPHEEIIERNQQSKYVKAAKLANEGFSVDEILEQVDLPRNELDFIAKVNREELTFNPELLPEWAKPREGHRQELEAQIVDRVFHTSKPDLTSLHKIEAKFRKTVRDVEESERVERDRAQQVEERARAFKQTAAQMTQGIMQSAGEILKTSGEALKTSSQAAKGVAVQVKPLIRKVQFPRIHIDKP